MIPEEGINVPVTIADALRHPDSQTILVRTLAIRAAEGIGDRRRRK
jgi:hypothetical protein